MGRGIPSSFWVLGKRSFWAILKVNTRKVADYRRHIKWRPSSFCIDKMLVTNVFATLHRSPPQRHTFHIYITLFLLSYTGCNMDVVLQELKRDDEIALQAQVKKAASRVARCRPSSRSFHSSQLQCCAPSVFPAAESAVSYMQERRLRVQTQQRVAGNSPVMQLSPLLGLRVDRDLHRLDSEVLSVRKEALSSLHEFFAPSTVTRLQVRFHYFMIRGFDNLIKLLRGSPGGPANPKARAYAIVYSPSRVHLLCVTPLVTRLLNTLSHAIKS